MNFLKVKDRYNFLSDEEENSKVLSFFAGMRNHEKLDLLQISNRYTEQIKYFNDAEGNEIFSARKN